MLVYDLNSDGASYSVIGEDDLSVTRIEIPDTYNSLPVTEVSAYFGDCENLKEIVVGHNVTKTDLDVFNIPSLEKIYFGRGIRLVYGSMADTVNLTDVYYSGTAEKWENVRVLFFDDTGTVMENATMHFGVLGKAAVLTSEEEKIFPYTHWNCIKEKPETIDSRKVLYDNSTSGLSADTVKKAIDELNAKNFDVTALDSWTDLLHLVRSGRAKEFVNVGDQFVSLKDGEELVWDVIGIDADVPVNEENKHSLTLQLRDCYANMPYSVPEASHFTAAALQPGQYYIKMKNYSSDPVYYGFTLNETLPMGGLIRISENTVYLYKSRKTESHSSFAVDSVSTSAEDMTGTYLKQENYHIHTEMGTLNYGESDIRKWMNSEEADWWDFANDRSLAPVDYLSIPGFCNGMDEDFLNAVNPVRKKTVLADGSEIVTEDKFFLLSDEEVYASGDGAYEYYKENSSLTEAGVYKDAARIKNFESNPRHWWLRNPASGDGGLMRVLTDGGVGSLRFAKILAYGIAPACCIC